MTPGKAGDLCKPKRALYRQASQEALKKPPLVSLAPQPVNGRCLSKINFLKTVNMLIFFSLRSILEAKAFYSPQQSWGLFLRLSKSNQNRSGATSAAPLPLNPNILLYGAFCAIRTIWTGSAPGQGVCFGKDQALNTYWSSRRKASCTRERGRARFIRTEQGLWNIRPS